MSMDTAKNVVIFGETGVGKSSVINMILGKDEAETSGDATGCTFDSKLYSVRIRGRSYHLYDTIGLGEGSTGTVEGAKAIGNLYNLLNLLSKNGGIHLLIFVVRSGRLTATIQKNYELFYKGFCETKVPIVIVVTGCEGESNGMEKWWGRNEQFFKKAAMSFVGQACVCSFRGRLGRYGYVNEDLVEQSKGLVEDLIVRHHGLDGWQKQPVPWLMQVWHFLLNLLKGVVSWGSIETYIHLLSTGMSTADALGVLKAMKS